jgi:hypothetical protein
MHLSRWSHALLCFVLTVGGITGTALPSHETHGPYEAPGAEHIAPPPTSPLPTSPPVEAHLPRRAPPQRVAPPPTLLEH